MSGDDLDPDAPLKGYAGKIGKESFVAIVWACFVVATGFLCVRLTGRFRHNGGLFPDDFWIAWAWICLLALLIIQTLQVEALWYAAYYFAGRLSLDDATMIHQATQLLRWQFAISTLFAMTMWSVKASFLATFYRLVYPLRWARWLWWCISVLTALTFLGCILVMLLMCDSPAEFFVPGQCQTPGENFMHVFAIAFSTAADVVTDLLIVGLSLSVLRTLQLDKAKKIGVALAFALVAVIVIVAMVRIELVVSEGEVDLVGLGIWSVVEAATALIVASLMTFGKLWGSVIGKLSSNRSRSQGASGESSNHFSRGRRARVSASETELVQYPARLGEGQNHKDLTGT